MSSIEQSEYQVPTESLPRTYGALKDILREHPDHLGIDSELWMIEDLVDSCVRNLPEGSALDPEVIYGRILRLPHFSARVYQGLGFAIGMVNRLADDLGGHPDGDPEIARLIADVCREQVRAKIVPLLSADGKDSAQIDCTGKELSL